jgi:hypothetical protein
MPSRAQWAAGALAARVRCALCLLALSSAAVALDNGVGLTPAMGYNTWDDFRCGGINASNLYRAGLITQAGSRGAHSDPVHPVEDPLDPLQKCR